MKRLFASIFTVVAASKDVVLGVSTLGGAMAVAGTTGDSKGSEEEDDEEEEATEGDGEEERGGEGGGGGGGGEASLNCCV